MNCVGRGWEEQGAGKQNEGKRSAGGNCARGGRKPESVTGTTRWERPPDVCASMAPSDPRIIA